MAAAARAARSKFPVTKLNTGASMPLFGLGTWLSKPGQVGAAVETALKLGYPHIDGAAVYLNEDEIGATLTSVVKPEKEGGVVPREELFYTSKLWNNSHGAEQVPVALQTTLKQLGLSYLDLYLVHWPVAFPRGSGIPGYDSKVDASITIKETWTEMEKLVDQGLVRAIGVSNFSIADLTDLLSFARIKPAVNQVELHPYNPQPKLLEFCEQHGIVLTAYSPLGSPGSSSDRAKQPALLSDPVIGEVASKHGKSPAQVLIRWAIERKTVVIPKSVTEHRIKENADVLDFALDKDDMAKIAGIKTRWRYVLPGWMPARGWERDNEYQ